MAKQVYTTGQILTAAQMTTLQANDYNQTVSAKTASYTLVAADAGTRITMSNASATTVTVNTAIFAAGDTLQITNIGAGICTITAGTATVSTAGVLTLAQNATGTLYFTSTGVSIFNGSAAAGGGKVLQVIHAITDTMVSSSTNVLADTGLTATITPTLATSKVLVIFSQNGCGKNAQSANNLLVLALLRGATILDYFEDIGGFTGSALSNFFGSSSGTFLDSPASTSALTYKTQFANENNVASVKVQESYGGVNKSASSITLMEIGA